MRAKNFLRLLAGHGEGKNSEGEFFTFYKCNGSGIGTVGEFLFFTNVVGRKSVRWVNSCFLKM